MTGKQHWLRHARAIVDGCHQARATARRHLSIIFIVYLRNSFILFHPLSSSTVRQIRFELYDYRLSDHNCQTESETRPDTRQVNEKTITESFRVGSLTSGCHPLESTTYYRDSPSLLATGRENSGEHGRSTAWQLGGSLRPVSSGDTL